MEFILTAGWEDGVAALTERLVRELAAGKKIVWLTSGGSNVPAAVQIMDNIPPNLKVQLTVLPVDERYGAVGHADSNWQQLLTAGFQPGGATVLPVLQSGLDFERTAARYDELAKKAFKASDIVIAQLGIGPDGHIAGILPHSPAAEDTASYVCGYKSQPYQRLTLTFAALKQVDVAYAFAFGVTKLEALQALQTEQLSLSEQPSQILKELPEAYVYNDQVGSR